jgi:hypothetical protein
MGKACWIALVYGMESSQAHPTPQGHSGEYKDDLMAPKTLHRARFAPEAAYGAFASELITCTTDAIVSKRVPSYGSNHCMLSSRTSSILYAPLQVCIQHMHLLGHSLHVTMMHTCLFSFHRNHSPSTRSLIFLCKTCNIFAPSQKSMT